MAKSILDEKKQKTKDIEAIQEVLVTGQENRKKGLSAVKEIETKKKHVRSEKIASRIEKANTSRKGADYEYLKQLREAVGDYISTLDPSDYPGWAVKILVTRDSVIALNNKPFAAKKGILAVLRSPAGNFYHKGLIPSFDPELDVLAARGLGIYIENTLDANRTGTTPTINRGDSGRTSPKS